MDEATSRTWSSWVKPDSDSIKGPHKATHGQGEATSQHSHRGQQTLRHEVPQAWGAMPILTLYARLVQVGQLCGWLALGAWG